LRARQPPPSLFPPSCPHRRVGRLADAAQTTSDAISFGSLAKRYGLDWNESIDSIHSFDPDLWIFGSLAEDAEVWADFFNKGVKQQKYIFPFRCQKFGT